MQQNPLNPPVPPVVQRYIRFCVVGFLGLFVDMSLLHFLASPSSLHWDITVSKIIASETAILNNFIWNWRWTFRSAGGISSTSSEPIQPIRQFLKFNLVCGSGLVLSVVVLHLALRFITAQLLIANFLSIVIVSLWNFLLTQRFVFSSANEQSQCPTSTNKHPDSKTAAEITNHEI
jgi:dolichol-phosphate mannosyltransferase